MATATTNKLPEFATEPQDNTFDEEIIDKSSELEDTGFVPNTTIRSSQMNTYMKMMIESLRGIVDGLYRQAAAQGEIKANSTAQEWQDYIQKGLTDLIKKTKVNNASTADTTTGNAGTATKLQTARIINISGDATGTAQSFDGTANVTIPVDVKKSAALDSTNVGDATHPVYFNNEGKPVEVNQKIANDTSGKADIAGTADEAIKLQTPRTISIAGDATGSASFDGSSNATITVDVNHAAALDSKNIGSSTNPVYIDANGKPQATGSSLDKSITGNAGTATKLQTPRNIALTGDVVGNANFDGSRNIEIETSTTIANAKSMVTNAGDLLNVGNDNTPTYFSSGKPAACNRMMKVCTVSYNNYRIYFLYSGITNRSVAANQLPLLTAFKVYDVSSDGLNFYAIKSVRYGNDDEGRAFFISFFNAADTTSSISQFSIPYDQNLVPTEFSLN